MMDCCMMAAVVVTMVFMRSKSPLRRCIDAFAIDKRRRYAAITGLDILYIVMSVTATEC